MTREELITLGQHKVRRDERLMLFYLQEFEKIFGRRPNCVGCSFPRDWKAFVKGKNNINFIKSNIMEKTFKLRGKGMDKVHSYHDGTRMQRARGNKMSEDFAIAYLANGTPEQIKERKEYFEVLPRESKKKADNVIDVEPETIIVVNGEEVFLSEATGKQMTAYGKENNIDFGEATRVDDKREVIAKSI